VALTRETLKCGEEHGRAVWARGNAASFALTWMGRRRLDSGAPPHLNSRVDGGKAQRAVEAAVAAADATEATPNPKPQ
jgi:hypothetical protein